MGKFYELALTEYRNAVSLTEGSYFLNILLSLMLILLYLLMIGVHTPFKKKVEIRHFGFLLGNSIYLIAVYLEFDSKGFLYTLGSISGEICSTVIMFKNIHTHIFIFSASFIYGFYLLLRLSLGFYYSLAISFLLASLLAGAYQRIPDVYLIVHSLAQSVLVSLAACSIWMIFSSPIPSLAYVENVSPVLIVGIFICTLARLVRRKFKKHLHPPLHQTTSS